MFEQLKKDSRPNEASSGLNGHRVRSIPVAMLLILVVLVSAGSGVYAGASFFAQQGANVTVTTTIYTTTTSWTTSTIWSTVTEAVQGILTTIEYTTSTSTVTMTADTTTATANFGHTNVGTANEDGNYLICSAFPLPVAGTIISMSFHTMSVLGSGPWKVKLGIYDDSNNSPRNLRLGPTEWVTTSLTTGWHTVSMTPTLLTPGTYWLCNDNNGKGTVSYAAAGSLKYKALSESSNWPDPAGTSFLAARATDAVYATYVPAAANLQSTEAVLYSNDPRNPLLNSYNHATSNFCPLICSDSSAPDKFANVPQPWPQRNPTLLLTSALAHQ